MTDETSQIVAETHIEEGADWEVYAMSNLRPSHTGVLDVSAHEHPRENVREGIGAKFRPRDGAAPQPYPSAIRARILDHETRQLDPQGHNHRSWHRCILARQTWPFLSQTWR